MSEEAIQRLVALYIKSSKRLLADFDDVTDFSQANRVALLRNVDKELTKLAKISGTWVDAEVRKSYQAGMEDAIDGLQILATKGAIDGSLPVTRLFTKPNERAVQALIDDASKAFGESLTTVGRSVRNITSQAFQREVRASIAEGVVSGQTRLEIVKDVKNALKANGLTGLVDKGGKQWSIDRYADMLARTKLTEARNTGLANKMLENGHDLVQVSINGSDHPACADYEGKILSLTGKTDGYDTVDEAEADGLWHPNCKHTVNPIEPELAKETYGWNSETGEYEQGIL